MFIITPFKRKTLTSFGLELACLAELLQKSNLFFNSVMIPKNTTNIRLKLSQSYRLYSIIYLLSCGVALTSEKVPSKHVIVVGLAL